MSEPVYQFNAEVAMEQFKKRKEENKGKQIDNSSLPAGAPMFYYCRFCGAHICTLPEGHTQLISTVCHPCKILRDHGLV